MVARPLAALDLKEVIPCFNSGYECDLLVLYLHKNAGKKFLGDMGVSFAN
jgi:hypothetical protein